jgi:glycosyltransferase involved in cell wall biosynthesis
LTGFVKGDELQILFSQARLFVMPSYHEGLPIALLEALSYSLPVVVSDIAPNKEVQLNADCYFPVKNVAALTKAINKRCRLDSQDYSEYLAKYDWHKIASQTVGTYNRILRTK